jgi:hypothetical protein
MKKKLGYWNLIFVALFFVSCAAFYLFAVPYQIGFKEQISIFLPQAEHLARYLSKPAFLAEIMGDFLTMFYFSNVVGAVISVILLIFLWLGWDKSLKRIGAGEESKLLALIPVAVESAFIVSLNYPISATVDYIVVVWAFALFSKIKNGLVFEILFGLAVPVLYYVAGGYVLVVLVFFCFFNQGKSIVRYFITISDVLLILFMGRMFNMTVLQSILYPIQLGYILPNTYLFVLPICAALITLILSKLTIKLSVKNVIGVIPALLSIGTSQYFAYNKQLEYSVELGTHAYKKEWKQLKELSLDNPDNNIFGIYYRNLSFAREGKLAAELLNYPQITYEGLFMNIVQGASYLEIFYYIDQLLLVGDISQATDCALLGQTVMPGNYSTRMLRTLSEISMAAGDYTVAKKYLNLLKSSPYHKRWAMEMESCIETDRIPDDLLTIRKSSALRDVLFEQNNWEESLRVISDNNPQNIMSVDYMLCAYLLGKNFNTFNGLYDKYYLDRLDRVIPVPDIYQEALLTTSDSQESFEYNVEKYHISPEVANRFLQFMDDQVAANGNIQALKKYSGTYWFYLMSTIIKQSENE